MTFSFRPATRSEAKPLIGFYAESGNGKTWSALLLARGFVGPSGKIGMIETEGGRGEANVGRAPVGQYLVRPIRGDFSPVEYGKAIDDAEKENLDALIIDSASHEWEGAGGVLAMAAQNDADGKKGVLIWQQPKIQHQRHFMLRLMQTPIPLVIVCMRAKYPMVQVKGNWARSTVLEPKQADDILFEMFVHGWIDAEHKLHVTKYTLPELADVICDNEPISIDTGRRLADWAKGGQASPRPSTVAAPADQPAPAMTPNSAAGAGEVSSDAIASWDKVLADAAEHGMKALQTDWSRIPADMKPSLKSALDRRHKPRAQEVDNAKQPA
jgi:hypothetical protein